MIGYQEMLVILLICLLFFGGKKIPEIARGLGKGIREFRKARDEIEDAIEREVQKPAPPAPVAPSQPAPDPTTATESSATSTAPASPRPASS